MTTPFDPLRTDELDELDQFLLYSVETDEVMTLEMMDGFLHAVAVGPTTVMPRQWLPKIWGTAEVMPPMASLEELNHILALVMRHYNSIIAGLEATPPDVLPIWDTSVYAGDPQEYDDAESWAYGFVQGMQLCWDDWQPLLATPQGQAWFRPIGLLGGEAIAQDQDALMRTPAQRAALALELPDAVLAMHAYWLPHRRAVLAQEMVGPGVAAPAARGGPKVGRNEPCPCGSGQKFKRCCGAASTLH